MDAAFRDQFEKQFNEGANAGNVEDVAQACHDVGVGQGGDQNWTCEGWGVVVKTGRCLVASVVATINSLPTLEAKELTPGTGLFDPGSCKIGGIPP